MVHAFNAWFGPKIYCKIHLEAGRCSEAFYKNPNIKNVFVDLWYLFGGDGLEEDSGCGRLTWGKRRDILQLARHHRISLYHGGGEMTQFPHWRGGGAIWSPTIPKSQGRGSWYFRDPFFLNARFCHRKVTQISHYKKPLFDPKKGKFIIHRQSVRCRIWSSASRIYSFSWAPYLSIQAHVFVKKWGDMVAYNHYIGSKEPVRMYKVLVWLV